VATLFLSFNVSGQEYVGGVISQDKIYTKDVGTYIVLDDVVVSESVELTIEPGVEVLFEPGDPDLRIVVNGNLNATGTEEENIYFGPRDGNEWGGILVNNSSGDFNMQFCEVEGATEYAIKAINRNNISIKNSVLHDNAVRAVSLINCNSAVIEENTILNSNYGIYLSSLEASLSNVITRNIFDNIEVAVFLNGQDGDTRNNEISFNRISNSFNGIQLDGGTNTKNNLIRGNQLYDNDRGILVTNRENNIERNILYHNSNAILVDGIEIDGGEDSRIAKNIFFENENAVTLEKQCYGNKIDSNQFIRNKRSLLLGEKTSIGGEANFIRYNIFIRSEDYAVTLNGAPQAEIQFNSFYEGDSTMFYLQDSSDQDALNNWWGSYIAQEIDRRIFDHNDNQDFGELNYIPFSVSPPIKYLSTPLNPKKQKIGDTLVVSWKEPPDERVAGYKVYYENDNGYAYQQTFDAGDTNRIFLPDLDINKKVAVTSYDAGADGITDQQENHESWFKIAQIYPYAGRDSRICEGETINFSESTAFNQDSVRWVTNGQGQLIDPTQLHPQYIHSESDINSEITFWLKQYDSTRVKQDSLELWVHPSADVDAGADTTILVDSSLVLEDAKVDYADSLLWITSGDGSYSDPRFINPSYHPGPEDMENQSVNLILEAYSRCGVFKDSIFLNIEPIFTVSGRVKASDSLPGQIQIYEEGEDSFSRASAQLLQEDNAFSFNLITRGKYYLLFIPKEPGTYFPTYYVNKQHWYNSHPIDVSANTYDLDIEPMEYNYHLPEGEGAINGIVENASESGNLRQIIYLTDTALHALDWVTPDSYGEFYFNNLPYGNYRILVEQAGLQPGISEVITLSPENPTISDIDIILTGKKIHFSGNYKKSSRVAVYPTIVNQDLNLVTHSDLKDVDVQIYKMNGVAVMREHFSAIKAHTTVQMNVSRLHAGVYLVNITSNDQRIHAVQIISTK